MSGYRTRLQFCIAALITNTVSYSFPPNANHIFNSIHSSMRQWGSSLNHNGMSFFLATVPEGTQLYHGDWLSDPVQGPEWLAFEAEHALVFTHPFPHNPPPGDGGSGGPEPGSPGPPPPLQDQSQQVIGQPMQAEAEDGYLHTFVAARDLRLLYVDGMSAGKTANGTMDTQDRILYQDKLKDGRDGMSNERQGAQLFCRMVKDKWNGRLDGLLRMEAGFEIILCDFSNLEVQQVVRVRPSGGKPGSDIGMHAGRMWLPAVASRYWNIGGERVTLNYDHFVTAFDYGLDLFANGKNAHPRLEHLPVDELEPMQQDLDALIMNYEAGGPSANWQVVADMVVERYGARLRFLVSGQASTLQQLQDEIEDIVTPFIDYDQRNTSIEVERCSKQFVRSSIPTTTTAADAVLSVSRTVCGTLLEALSYTEYDSVVGHVQSLMNYLAWTTWKDCTGCGDHEICMIPMWPMGTVDDYNNPQCRDFSQPNGDGPRYWGPGRGPPPPRKARPTHTLAL